MIHEETLEIEPTLIRSHYSALTAHRTCAAKWHYRYVLRIKRPDVGPKPELHFGSWFGALTAAEGLERGRKLGTLKAAPGKLKGPDDGPEWDQRTVTPAEVFEGAKSWWRSRDAETIQAWNEKLGEDLPHRLRALYRAWMDEFADARKNEQPLGFEVFWKRELSLPPKDREWLGPEGSELQGVDLIGYIDEVYFDVERGEVVVRDKKTHKVLEKSTFAGDMMDSQLQLYAWGATPLISAWGLGEPRAVAYDRARSVAPKTPELTKTAGSLSKSQTDSSYGLPDYRKWAATDTRPMAAIEQWLVNATPYTDPETGEISDPIIDATEEQIEFVRSLPPGQFWGEFGAFLLSGARKGNPKFGVYVEDPKMVEQLGTAQSRSIWFQRTHKPINSNVITGHLRAAMDTAVDAWRTERRVKLTGDAPRSLSTKNCEWCDYAAICRARLMGGPRGEYDLAEFGLEAPDGATFLINGKLEKELV